MTVTIENMGNIFKDAEKKCIQACINTVNIQAAETRKNLHTKTLHSAQFVYTYAKRSVFITLHLKFIYHQIPLYIFPYFK